MLHGWYCSRSCYSQYYEKIRGHASCDWTRAALIWFFWSLRFYEVVEQLRIHLLALFCTSSIDLSSVLFSFNVKLRTLITFWCLPGKRHSFFGLHFSVLAKIKLCRRPIKSKSLFNTNFGKLPQRIHRYKTFGIKFFKKTLKVWAVVTRFWAVLNGFEQFDCFLHGFELFLSGLSAIVKKNTQTAEILNCFWAWSRLGEWELWEWLSTSSYLGWKIRRPIGQWWGWDFRWVWSEWGCRSAQWGWIHTRLWGDCCVWSCSEHMSS